MSVPVELAIGDGTCRDDADRERTPSAALSNRSFFTVALSPLSFSPGFPNDVLNMALARGSVNREGPPEDGPSPILLVEALT